MSSNRLLLDEKLLMVQPRLAVVIGLNEAIALQQIHYWLVENRAKKQNFQDGRYWTYNTLDAWQIEFPFWSISTLRRTFDSLQKRGVLICAKLSPDKRIQTLWYSIDYDALEKVTNAIVQIEQMQSSNMDTSELSKLNKSNKDTKISPEISSEITTTKTAPAPKTCEVSEPDVVVFSIPEILELTQSPPAPSETTGEASRAIVTALIDKGITPAKAQVLTQNYDPALIKKQISALKHRTATDPAAALVRSIEEDWSVPAKAVNEALEGKKQAEKRDKEAEARRQREMATIDKQALEKAWEALDKAKKEEIEQKAREIIIAQPMGSRMLEGVLGAKMVRAKCLEYAWER